MKLLIVLLWVTSAAKRQELDLWRNIKCKLLWSSVFILSKIGLYIITVYRFVHTYSISLYYIDLRNAPFIQEKTNNYKHLHEEDKQGIRWLVYNVVGIQGGLPLQGIIYFTVYSSRCRWHIQKDILIKELPPNNRKKRFEMNSVRRLRLDINPNWTIFCTSNSSSSFLSALCSVSNGIFLMTLKFNLSVTRLKYLFSECHRRPVASLWKWSKWQNLTGSKWSRTGLLKKQ